MGVVAIATKRKTSKLRDARSLTSKLRKDARRRRNVSTGSYNRTLRLINQGYGEVGASGTRRALKKFTPMSGSPAGDIDDYNFTLRQRARTLYMGAPIATSAVRTNRTNVIGTGLRPKPTIDADALGMTAEEAIEWQKTAEREFALWAEDKRACDATGVNNFYAMQQLALVSWLVSGDVFALVKRARPTLYTPYGLRLHLIEADRVATPTSAVYASGYHMTTRVLDNGNLCYDGVEIDKAGAIVAYHIRSTYPEEYPYEPSDWTRVLAYGRRTGLPNILHIMDAERPEQYRGVSYLAQVIEPLLQLRRYTESELVAAVVQSMFTAWVKTEAAPDEFPFEAAYPDEEIEEPGTGENEYAMGPGQVNVLKPGEDIVFGDPKRPVSGFSEFVRSVSEQVGAALEIPADLLLKSFNSSYSASRAALMEAWKSFRMRRTWFVDDFCQPVWTLWMSEAVARGRLYAPGFFDDPLTRSAYLSCDWVGPSQGQLDPTKEISAEILAINNGLTTHTDAAIRLNGSKFDDNVARLAHENERLAEAQASAIAPGDAETAIRDTVASTVTREATSSIEGGENEQTGSTSRG